MADRLAQLWAEIEHRDRKIEELEQQLKIKNSIINKQGIMLAHLQEDRPK